MARTRMRTYLLVRVGALAMFLLAVTVVPRGAVSALLVVGAGLVAVVSSMWSNAGGPGEMAGARPQNRWFDSVTPPQGDWPPYDAPPAPPTERD